MSSEQSFDDLTPIEIPYRIAGQPYVLREASGDVGAKWHNAILKSTRMVDGKVTSMEGVADSDPLLVALCLFEQTDKGEKQVSVNKVRGWPNRVVKALASKVKEISDLTEKDSAERKALLLGLDRPNAPVSLDAFREWASALAVEDDSFKPLVNLVRPASEDRAKN